MRKFHHFCGSLPCSCQFPLGQPSVWGAAGLQEGRRQSSLLSWCSTHVRQPSFSQNQREMLYLTWKNLCLPCNFLEEPTVRVIQLQDLPHANYVAFSGTESDNLEDSNFCVAMDTKQYILLRLGSENKWNKNSTSGWHMRGLAQLTQKQQAVGDCRAPEFLCQMLTLLFIAAYYPYFTTSRKINSCLPSEKSGVHRNTRAVKFICLHIHTKYASHAARRHILNWSLLLHILYRLEIKTWYGTLSYGTILQLQLNTLTHLALSTNILRFSHAL